MGGFKRTFFFNLSWTFLFFVVFWAQLATKSPFWGGFRERMGYGGGGLG